MRGALHAGALADYREAARYYATRAPRLSEAFVEEVEAAIDTIRTAPRTRAANERGVRRFLLRRFPYLLYYAIEKEAAPSDEELIVFYAIRHSRRDQSGWLHRLPSGNT